MDDAVAPHQEILSINTTKGKTVKKKVLLSAIAAGALVLGLSACAPESVTGGGDGDKGLIGVAMPTQESERWIKDGNAVKEGLEAEGYTVDLQYAQDDIPKQIEQIDAMITKGAKVLIIAAKDGTALTDQLQQAADAGIKVIAYDRLINGSENVDYYTTFDNYGVGVQQAYTLLAGLGVTDIDGAPIDGVTGPFNIELFAGSPDDNNTKFFFNGAMDTLNPFIESGVLVVKSGQTAQDVVATQDWKLENAQARMENLLTANYADGSKVDGVLSPYDGLSRGIISALTDVGYEPGPDFPIITGQDAELDSVKAIVSGEQYATIFKDTRDLAAAAVEMTLAILAGEEPTTNDSETYDNGVKVVPTNQLTPYIVRKDDIQKLLIDSGYYAAGDVPGL
jgi:putative multiple sugar transport system substrate-binding protein